MRRSFAVHIALLGVVPLLYGPLLAQSRAKAANIPPIPYESVPNFFKNPPGIYTGENMGIATNSKGQHLHLPPRQRDAPLRVHATGKLRA